MINKELILEFATAKHKGQTRKHSNESYINHPIRVANKAVERQWMLGRRVVEPAIKDVTDYIKDRLWIVSILHDVLEDCNATAEEISSILLQAGCDQYFIKSVLADIGALTKKRENFDIIQYLYRIRMREFATIVKLADLEDNMSDLRPGNLLDKYKLCKHFLTQ